MCDFNIDAVVVLYNSELKSIKALDVLLTHPLVRSVVVCDNSDDGMDHMHMEKSSKRIRTFNMGGNVGLSRAYNFAVSKCTADYVLILDDDSELPVNYFETAASHIAADDADVYMPLVRSSKILMSPCRKKGKRFVALDGAEQISGMTISGINSGLIVRRSTYDKVSYREELFLDMVDHAFFDDVHAAGLRISVMTDVVLLQDYSRETDDFEAAKSRYLISKRDNRAYFNGPFADRAFCEAQLLYWKLKKAARFKRLSVLTW